MRNKDILQNTILRRLKMERQVVTIIITNGYQMKGRIVAYDRYLLVLEIRGEQQIIYKHAISTITPAKPVDLEVQPL